MCAVFTLLGVLLLSCYALADTRSSAELVRLLAATSRPVDAAGVTDQKLEDIVAAFPPGDVARPIATFVAAEIHLLKGSTARARSLYRELAEWGAADGSTGGWGGSSLAVFALWRWLELIGDERPADKEDAGRAVDAGLALKGVRFARGVFADPALISLPRLEEDLVRRLADTAWTAGKQQEAISLFIEYLNLTQTSVLTGPEQEMAQSLVNEGYASEERLDLLRGKRYFELRNNEEAAARFENAAKKGNPQVRAEAHYYLSQIKRRLERDCKTAEAIVRDLEEVVEDAGNPDLAQEALYFRGMLRRASGCPTDDEGFLGDMQSLVTTYPLGKLSDDALYQIARYYSEETEELDQAFEYYERLRAFDGPNDFENFARARPAWILYARGQQGDLDEADRLFQEIISRFPDGQLYLTALFWRGRIAEDRGAQEAAAEFFQTVISTAPYSYYAIRARMHLSIGRDAAAQLPPDERTTTALRKLFEESKSDAEIVDPSLYSQRLRFAIESGLYQAAIGVITSSAERDILVGSKDLPLAELDAAGIIPRLALLLSFRQDALAAKDLNTEPMYRLKLAGALGSKGQDWPIALRLIAAQGEPEPVRWALQQDERYLATAHPPVFVDVILAAAKTYGVPPALLYSVMLHESHFDPAAASVNNASGLFQFIPSTFAALDKKWHLLAGGETREEFLLEPKNSINLGARWFDEELLPSYAELSAQTAFAVMEHNIGEGAVKSWIKDWDANGRTGDVEYVIDTVPVQATRRLVREVMGTMWLLEASTILLADSAPREGVANE